MTELQVVEGMSMSVIRKPEAVLAEARDVAVALKKAISDRYAMQKRKPLEFNNKQYLELEDWQMIGKFYGITAKVITTEAVQHGEAFGFKSRAAAVDIQSGRVISEAEALCMNDEEKWRSRPKYEYHYVCKDGHKQLEDPAKDQIVWIDNPNKPGKSIPKKERVQVGEEKVPTFQIMSMSETRACSKALKLCLSWVATMAGYSATPAEEVDEATVAAEEQKPPIAEPQRASETGAEAIKAGPKWRKMKAGQKSPCDNCADDIQVGDEIYWKGDEKKASHVAHYK